MGNELPMAREKRAGQQVLLVGASNGEFVPASSSRNKRKEEAGTSKRKALKTPLSATQAGKSSPEAKASSDDAYKAKGHRRSHKAGKSVREHEGRDSSSRRSASKLDVNWPEDRCWESPTHAHWFTVGSKIGGGSIWVCKYCLRAKWMPEGWTGTDKFAMDIDKHGIDEAYLRWLDRQPAVVNLLRKLEDLRLLKKAVPVEEYTKVVAAVMSDKDYPYEEIE